MAIAVLTPTHTAQSVTVKSPQTADMARQFVRRRLAIWRTRNAPSPRR